MLPISSKQAGHQFDNTDPRGCWTKSYSGNFTKELESLKAVVPSVTEEKWTYLLAFVHNGDCAAGNC